MADEFQGWPLPDMTGLPVPATLDEAYTRCLAAWKFMPEARRHGTRWEITPSDLEPSPTPEVTGIPVVIVEVDTPARLEFHSWA